MKAVTVQNMRLLEERAITKGISGFQLMARAGRAAADVVRREARRRNCRTITVVTGKGNNAGDGFVAASLLAGEFPVALYTAYPISSLRGDALSHAGLMPDNVQIFEETLPEFSSDTLIVDALLGTGFSGTVRESLAEFIKKINLSRRPVISMDLPSGLNGDTGEALLAVRADATVTFGLPKAGLFRGRGAELSGVISVGDLAIPADMIDGIEGEFETVFAEDAAALMRPLKFDDYKNTRGRVLIAGGSTDYPGAPLLSALGAMRSGAGFVRLATAAVPYTSLPAALVVHKLPSENGCAGEAAAMKIRELLPLTDAVAAGMGWSRSKEPAAVLKVILDSGIPAVFDADALNLLAAVPELKISNSNTILTPHAGEAARLFAGLGINMPESSMDGTAKRRRDTPAEEDSESKSGSSVEGATRSGNSRNRSAGGAFRASPDGWSSFGSAVRIECACELSQRSNATVILKGPQSVIASPDGRYAINSSGTAALGICGSGDVLAGVAAAFLAAGMNAFDAACLAANLHGSAGDVLPRRGLIADELPELIRQKMAEISTFS